MIQVGLIGCGFIAKKHVKTISTCEELELKAVSDLDQERMQEISSLYKEFKKRNSSISFYKDYKQLIADPEIAVVIIATISSLHAEIAKKALKNDKHVIIEKPLALTLRDADDIIQLSKTKSKQVLVCHQLRYRPVLEKLKFLLNKDYFGKLYFGTISLRLHRSFDYYNSSTWKGTWDQDGGMLLNQGIHLIDLLIWFFGDAHSVYGEIDTKIKNKETEDIATGIITFKNQAKGVIEANTITTPKNLGYSLSIFGEKGSICIGGTGFNKIEHCYIEEYPKVKDELLKLQQETNEHERMYDAIIKSITKSKQHLMNADEGRKALELIFALYQSARNGKPVFLPVKNFSTIDMLK
ncbi:Gfo/Idh/MocA family protein [Pseudogracilibacillus sp. SO30301A]|uniref:Gfo/Idh/MocA family protein n=1 Tax=Pseudogracilibacillus sp. SO30301A TaxID=3098291 RepID=UPI00300E2AB5